MSQQEIFAALRGGIQFKRQAVRSRGAPAKRQKTAEPAPAAAAPAAAAAAEERTPEELNALRNRRKIRVAGADAPVLLPDLPALAALPGCPQALLDNIAALGWSSLTDTQMQSIPALLDDRDILSCAPTGSGKTGAFVIPLLIRLLRTPPRAGADRSPRAVILAPTRELATQIAREAARLAKDTGLDVQMLGKGDEEAVAAACAACDVLVSTPLRLATAITAARTRFEAVEMLVVRQPPRRENAHAGRDDELLPLS